MAFIGQAMMRVHLVPKPVLIGIVMHIVIQVMLPILLL